MTHELKIWPQYYVNVANGSKTFELRNNDRAFQKGDTVVLKEWDPTPDEKDPNRNPKGYTKAVPLTFEIGFVYVLDGQRVIFSLLPPKQLSLQGML